MKTVKHLPIGLITVNINGRIEVFTPSQYETYKEQQRTIKTTLKAFNIGFVVVFIIGVLSGVFTNQLN